MILTDFTDFCIVRLLARKVEKVYFPIVLHVRETVVREFLRALTDMKKFKASAVRRVRKIDLLQQ